MCPLRDNLQLTKLNGFVLFVSFCNSSKNLFCFHSLFDLAACF